jgi:hypothetical protein
MRGLHGCGAAWGGNMIEDAIRGLGAWSLLERIAREYRVLPAAVLNQKQKHPAACRARERFVFILEGSTGFSRRELDRLLGYGWGTVQAICRRQEARVRAELNQESRGQ